MTRNQLPIYTGQPNVSVQGSPQQLQQASPVRPWSPQPHYAIWRNNMPYVLPGHSSIGYNGLNGFVSRYLPVDFRTISGVTAHPNRPAAKITDYLNATRLPMPNYPTQSPLPLYLGGKR